MYNKIKLMKSINPFLFIKWNYLSRKVKRDKGCYLFPAWGAVINIEKNANLVLHSHLSVNYPKYPRSTEEAFLFLRSGAQLIINGNVSLCSRSTIQLQEGGKLEIGSAHINHGASILVGGNTKIGDEILISRDVKIFDSDFHKIIDDEGRQTNMPKPMIIGNHVWIGLGAIILRGSQIGDGAVISAGAVVMGKIKEGTNAIGNPARSFSNINWEG